MGLKRFNTSCPIPEHHDVTHVQANSPSRGIERYQWPFRSFVECGNGVLKEAGGNVVIDAVQLVACWHGKETWLVWVSYFVDTRTTGQPNALSLTPFSLPCLLPLVGQASAPRQPFLRRLFVFCVSRKKKDNFVSSEM